MHKFELLNYNIRSTNKNRTIFYGTIVFNIYKKNFCGIIKENINIKCKYEYSIKEKIFIFIKDLYINNIPEEEYFKFKDFEYCLNYKKWILKILNNNLKNFYN